MWDLIVSVPDHCLSFYFLLDKNNLLPIYLVCHCVICVLTVAQRYVQMRLYRPLLVL